MAWIALKMLTGNRGRYYAIVFGIAFAVMLMSQQAAIFVGLMRNTTSQIRDIQGADIWVMNKSVEFVDDITPMSDNDLYRVRGVPGVLWAIKFYKGTGRAQFPEEGSFKQFIILGLDDETLVGAPSKLVLGSIGDLREPDAVIIDEIGFNYLWPGQKPHIGQTFEMNDHRAHIVGICKASPTFQTFPIIYTRYSLALNFAPQERRVLSFVLAKTQPGLSTAEVCERIKEQCPELEAYSNDGFAWLTIMYYMRRTGIPINFGTTVMLGFIIGAAIAGQTFYLFTVANLKQFGALKAMGTSNPRIVGMVLVQGAWVGAIGYGIGLGIASLIDVILKMRLKDVPPISYMAWPIPLGTAVAVALIVLGTTLFSLRRVLVLEPASVFR
jgi:putative ABC transport system permease protein